MPGLARAENDRRFNLESADYPVVVVSGNAEYGSVVLELVNHSFRHFSNTMGIKSFAPMRFYFVLEDNLPTEVCQDMEPLSYPRSLSLADKQEFKVGIPSRDFNPVAVVRTAMICQVEAFVLKDKRWDPAHALPQAPFWLTEGLTQASLDKRTPDLERIIARIDKAGPVPSLETIQSWKALSPHRLEQWWQQAACYWLVRQATRSGADREALCAWLPHWFSERAHPYWDKNAEIEVWWKKTLGERSRDRAVVKGEEQTKEELQRCLQFKARLKGESISKDFDLAKLPKPPIEFASVKPFEEVMKKLLLLQTRGNFLWQEVIEAYRTAYSFWLKGKYENYLTEIARAEGMARSISAYMTKTREYMDWYEVNHPAPGPKLSTLLRESLAFQDREELAKWDQAEIAAKLTLIESGK